jgi:glycine/D-amino acid oxidase-like deaminating enzyme
VRRVVVEGAATGVELGGGFVRSGAVVVAAGSWSGAGRGRGGLATVVRPAAGARLDRDAPPPLLRHVVAVPGRGYLVRARRHVLAGSAVGGGLPQEVTVGGLAEITLARTLVRARGALGHRQLVNFARTEDHLPVLGRHAGARAGARDRALP